MSEATETTTRLSSLVEPPFNRSDADDRLSTTMSLLARMGRKPTRQVIYTTLPACNSEA